MQGVYLKQARLSMATISIVTVFILGGCSMVSESVKGVLGVSTREIEKSRSTALAKTYDLNVAIVHDQVKHMLVSTGSSVYSDNKKKNLLAFYVSELDTTPVGVFFTSLGDSKTQIEVSSPSSYAKEFMFGKIVAELGNYSQAREVNPVQE